MSIHAKHMKKKRKRYSASVMARRRNNRTDTALYRTSHR